MRLLFEGGDYNIQGLAGGGYYSRAATIRGRRLFEGGDYSRAASDRGNTVWHKLTSTGHQRSNRRWLHFSKYFLGCLKTMYQVSLARATPVWKNRGLVTALHTTSSDGMQLADVVGRAAVAQLTKCKDGVNNN